MTMDKEAIISFAKGDITTWNGLPAQLLPADLIMLFGQPVEAATTTLGYYPAERIVLAGDAGSETLVVFIRDGIVMMIEALQLPGVAALKQLPDPGAILPPEILVEGAYAAEYIYHNRGLALTVAKHFDQTIPDRIIRCRGFRQLNNATEFNANYYMAFEDQEVYAV